MIKKEQPQGNSPNGNLLPNFDMVSYDGQETYNITKNTLQPSGPDGERINELTQLAERQKVEINRLHQQLESLKNSQETNEFLKAEKEYLNKNIDNENLSKLVQSKGMRRDLGEDSIYCFRLVP